MRTINAGELALLKSRHYNIHVRFWMRDPWAKWRNLAAMEGVNFLQSISIEENQDQAVSSFSASFRREANGFSLSPLLRGLSKLDGTYVPYIGPATEVRIDAACTPPGATQAVFRNIFVGLVDEADWAGNKSVLQVSGRDMGAVLLDAKIEREETYGSASGVLVTTVMKQIMTDVMGFGSPSIVVIGTPPTLLVKTYVQERKSLLEALRDLAFQSGGYDLRYRFDSTGKFVLGLFHPNRTTNTSLATFGPTEWVDVTDLRMNLSTVRNAIETFYEDPNGRVLSVSYQDNASIERFKQRRYEPIQAPALATEADAEAMCQAMLADLSYPKAEEAIRLPYFWPAQLGDLYTLEADGKHWGTSHKAAVTSIRHEIANGHGWTTLALRGQPSAATYEWLRRASGTPISSSRGGSTLVIPGAAGNGGWPGPLFTTP